MPRWSSAALLLLSRFSFHFAGFGEMTVFYRFDEVSYYNGGLPFMDYIKLHFDENDTYRMQYF